MIDPIKYRINKALLSTLAKLGMRPTFDQKNNTRILVYHGITQFDPLQFNSRFLSVGDFEKHLVFFKEQSNINVCSLQDIVAGNTIKDKLNIALTFDDGYLNNFTLAAPLLEKHQIPATFAVTPQGDHRGMIWCDLLDLSSALFPHTVIKTGDETLLLKKNKQKIKSHLMSCGVSGIDHFFETLSEVFEDLIRKEELNEYWQLMKAKDLSQLASSPLFEIIPHGSLHLNLAALSKAEIQNEILDSIDYVNRFNSENAVYCLAFGNQTKEVQEQLHKVGMKTLLGLDSCENAILDRFVMNPHLHYLTQMNFIYKGNYI